MSDDETMPPPEKPKRRRSAKVVKPPVAVEAPLTVEVVEPPPTAEAVELVHDQAFFLDLARPRPGETHEQVKERWNTWRRNPANNGVWVTFEGVDFRTEENRGISFEGFEFGNRARFDGATFGDSAGFSGATFGYEARFEGATFGDWAGFSGATFGYEAWFEGATFGDWAWFEGATFGDWARFEGATFGDWARFEGATFGWGAGFLGRAGEGDVTALRSVWERTVEKDEVERREAAYRARREAVGFGPSKFSGLSFASARFLGDVTFARRSFERPADFTNVRFEAPPDVDGASNLQRIDFTGARVGFVGTGHPWWKPAWTTKSSIAIRLRALRSQIEATKNHDFERDLYIEERKAERGIHWARLWREVRSIRVPETTRLVLRLGLRLPPEPKLPSGRWQAFGRWGESVPDRRGFARPAFIDPSSAASRRLRRIWFRRVRRLFVEQARVLRALLPLLGHLVWIGVMALYWAFADYGRSWVRPAVWLVVSLLAFHGGGSIEGIDARLLSERRAAAIERVVGDEARTAVAAQYDEAVRLYSVANSIPFVGPLTVDGDVKKFLFCGETGKGVETAAASEPKPRPCVPLPPRGFQLATIGQNLLSILLVFFMGLALRNYFRLK